MLTQPQSRRAAVFSTLAACLSITAGHALGNENQILLLHDDSLTSYKPGSDRTAIQDIRPLVTQRGVYPDGTRRAGGLFHASIAANPWGEEWNRNARSSSGLNLATGAFGVAEVDIALPAEGFGWVVGRTYSVVQDDGSTYGSDGYQGAGWHQMSQPEILFHDDDGSSGTEEEEDMVYLVYGADRYLEFRRVMDGASPTDVFRGVNGAAGAFEFVEDGSGADTYVYTDQRGNQFTFFGFDTASGVAKGSLWKIEDPASNVAYIGSTTKATAITDGYGSSGRIEYAYDTSDRRYSYSYGTFDSITRLTEVKVETKTGGTWASPTGLATVTEVDYDYYLSSDTYGGQGDLKLVTITTPMSQSGINLTRNKYFRYWSGTYNASTNPGHDNAIQYIVDFEGTRAFDWADETFDGDYETASENSLKPYAAAYFEYDSNQRIIEAWYNGECGCSGANNGTYSYEYETNGLYSDGSGYDQTWAARTVTQRPDGAYETQYFDEVAQPLGRVITDGDPDNTTPAPDTWATNVTRNSSALVRQVRTPANATGYTHSTGTISGSATVGLVHTREYENIGAAKNLPEGRFSREGTPANNYYHDAGWQYDTDVKDTIGGVFDVVRPMHSEKHTYATEVLSTGGWTSTGQQISVTVNGTTMGAVTLDSSPPTVTTAQNGPNTAVTGKSSYRDDGTMDFAKSADEIVSYREYSNGQLVKSITDADTTKTGAGEDFNGVTIPTGYSSSGSPEHRVTEITYDAQGRPDETTIPDGRVRKMIYTCLADHRIVQISIPRVVSGTTFHGPASYSVRNHAGNVVASGMLAFSGGSTTTALNSWIDETDDDPITALNDATWLARWSTSVYNESGSTLNERRAYFDIPSSGDGTEGTNFDATYYGYDDMGRRVRTLDPTGTIARQSFDGIGRPLASYVGLNDSSFSGGSPSGTDDMVKVGEVVYDGSSDGGNSLVTKRTAFVEDGATDKRETTFMHDEYGRTVVTLPPAAPYTLRKFDHRGRVIATGTYSSTSGLDAGDDPTTLTSNRLSLTEMAYDNQGRVYQTTRHAIATNGTSSDTLVTNHTYDSESRRIRTIGEQIIKTYYDRLGRTTHTFVLAKVDDTTNPYADADDLADDIVLEERQMTYDDDGMLIMRAIISRHADDTGVGATDGALDTNADGDDLRYTAANLEGRIQISAMWYDDDFRLADTVAYGTYGGANFDRDGLAVPARSDTALRTTVSYNDDATRLSSTGPDGVETRFEYDDLGRMTKQIRNYADGTPGGGTLDDEDQTTKYEYTDGLRTKLIADLPSPATDQETVYTHGVTKGASAGDSEFSHGGLLRETTYPDSGSGTDVVTYAYNAQGQRVWMEDQAGNITESTFDDRGRETSRAITTLASGFDGAVRRIDIAFASTGFLETVTQYDAAISGSVVDQVQFRYGDWDLVTEFEQDRDSAVNSNAWNVEYVYEKVDHDTGNSRYGREAIRRTSMTYPNGDVVDYEYKTTWDSRSRYDDDISRVTTVEYENTTIASYGYMGAGTPVETYLDEPEIYSNRYDASGGTYAAWDRFNRVTTDTWTLDAANRTGSSDSDIYDQAISWNRVSNITDSQDSVLVDASGNGKHDWAYEHDDLSRLVDAERGDWNVSAIATLEFEETWSLSQVGNWEEYTLDLNGDTDLTDTGDLDEIRTHNDFNELTARDTDADSTDDVTLTYDAVGNLTDDGESCDYEYDAFGRLRKVKDRATSALVAEYWYNGLGYRITVHEDTDNDGDVDGADKKYHSVYDVHWREIAVYRESDTDPKETYVHHAAAGRGISGGSYIDALIHVNRDMSNGWTGAADGALELRYHPLQNWRADVIATVNSGGSRVEEWVRYDPYGMPTAFNPADQELDGDLEPADYTRWLGHNSNARVIGDLNLSAANEPADYTTWLALYNTGEAAGRGVQSRSTVGGRRGSAGHVWDAGIAMIQARHRSYSPAHGQWLRRDPLGHSSTKWSASVYVYVDNAPITKRDPSGLIPNVSPRAQAALNDALACGSQVLNMCLGLDPWGDLIQSQLDTILDMGDEYFPVIMCMNDDPLGSGRASWISSTDRPSVFIGTDGIDLTDPLDQATVCQTLLHELVHVEQFVRAFIEAEDPAFNPTLDVPYDTRIWREFDAYRRSRECLNEQAGPARDACLCRRACQSVCMTSDDADCQEQCRSDCMDMVDDGRIPSTSPGGAFVPPWDMGDPLCLSIRPCVVPR